MHFLLDETFGEVQPKLIALVVAARIFTELGTEIHNGFAKLVQDGVIIVHPEPDVPKVVKDFAAMHKAGMVRKSANFVCSISDDRGEECTYAGMPISKVVKEGGGFGGAISLLWFRRQLPDYCLRFLEMCLVIRERPTKAKYYCMVFEVGI